MKGWKTIIFNALMLIGGLTGAHLDPALVTAFAEEFLGVLAVGNGILRAVTSTPIFSGRASDAGRALRGLAIAGLCLFVVGCGGPVTQTLAKGVDEACAQFNANPLTALPLRKQTVGAINALTVNGNYTPADCDSDGQQDFEIDANGQPLPAAP